MIALAVVAAQYTGTLDAMVSARSDARINDPAAIVSVEGRNEEIVVGADASLAAAAFLRLRDKHWDFSFAYSPSLLVPDLELQVDRDVNPPVDPTVFNAASATARWHNKYSWFSIGESGGYGTISTTVPYSGAPTTPTPQQQTPTQGMGGTGSMTTTPLPNMGTSTTNQTATQSTLFRQRDVQYLASSSSLGVGTTLGRRTAVTLTGSYSVSGGLDADTTVVPYQRGPTGSLSIATRLSRTDAIYTTVSGNDTYMKGECPLNLFPGIIQAVATGQAFFFRQSPPYQLPCTTRNDDFQVLEGYRHQTSRLASISATVGAAGVRGPTYGGGDALGIVPVFAVTYTTSLYTWWPGTLTLTAEVAPSVDLLTSIISDVASATATLNARVTKLVNVTFSLVGSQSIPYPPPGDSPLSSVAGSVEARFKLTKEADVLLGDQEYWQQQAYGNGPSQWTFTSIAYVGVTLRTPTLHF